MGCNFQLRRMLVATTGEIIYTWGGPAELIQDVISYLEEWKERNNIPKEML